MKISYVADNRDLRGARVTVIRQNVRAVLGDSPRTLVRIESGPHAGEEWLVLHSVLI
jgi:hypothetical protein